MDGGDLESGGRLLRRLAGLYGVGRFGEQYAGWKALPAPLVTPAPMTLDEAAAFVAAEAAPLVEHITDPELRIKAKGVGTVGILQDAGSFTLLYRVAAKRLHPDAGGAPERWQMLQQAAGLLRGHHHLNGE